MSSLTWRRTQDGSWVAYTGAVGSRDRYAQMDRTCYRNSILWKVWYDSICDEDIEIFVDDLNAAKDSVEASYAAEQSPEIVEATVQAKSVLVVMSDGRRWRVLLSELETAPEGDNGATVTAWLQAGSEL